MSKSGFSFTEATASYNLKKFNKERRNVFFRKKIKIKPNTLVAFDAFMNAEIGKVVAVSEDGLTVFAVKEDRTPVMWHSERCVTITEEEYERYKELTRRRISEEGQ